MKKIILILELILLPSVCFSQEENVSEITGSIVEELSEDENYPEAAEIYTEKLSDLIDKPIRINSADESELSRLFFLTDFQVKALADYIRNTGRIYSIYEIASIPGFDTDLARMLSPFLSLDSETKSGSVSSVIRSVVLSSFSRRFPASDTSAPGQPWKLLTKYKFSAGRVSGSFMGEKDAGELLLSGKPSLPDFISASLAWTGKGVLRKVIAGDFGARFGLGTGINTGLSTGLSLTQPGYLSGGDEIKSYTSTDENIFFRGAAVQLQAGRTGLTFFSSINRIDATVDTIDNEKERFIETFQRSGLHSTISSVAGKDAVTEFCYGINASNDFKYFRLGVLWTSSRFSLPAGKRDPGPEDIFDFTGAVNITATAYYKAIFGRILLYGEVSSNQGKRFAFVQGLSFHPSDRLMINVLYRDYEPGFKSFHGRGLFSGSAGDNIRGVFANFTFEAARYLFLSAGCDLRINPWLKYRCSAPSLAVKRELRLKYLPSDKITFEAIYTSGKSSLNRQETNGIKKQEGYKSQSIKGIFRYFPVENLTLTTRIDYKTAQPDGGRGMLLLQDFCYRFVKIPLSVWFRHSLFKTDSWESRLYAYENDLLSSFSIPALSGEGSRSYIMIAWKANKFLNLRIKYGVTEMVPESESGKNYEEIKMQVKMWF